MLSNKRGWVAAMFAAAAVSSGVSATSAEPADGTLKYAITRNGSNIGSHVIRYQRTGPGLVIEHKIRVSVKVLFVEAYHYESDRTETWKDNKLVSLKSHTNDNGDQIDVQATASESG